MKKYLVRSIVMLFGFMVLLALLEPNIFNQETKISRVHAQHENSISIKSQGKEYISEFTNYNPRNLKVVYLT